MHPGDCPVAWPPVEAPAPPPVRLLPESLVEGTVQRLRLLGGEPVEDAWAALIGAPLPDALRELRGLRADSVLASLAGALLGPVIREEVRQVMADDLPAALAELQVIAPEEVALYEGGEES